MTWPPPSLKPSQERCYASSLGAGSRFTRAIHAASCSQWRSLLGSLGHSVSSTHHNPVYRLGKVLIGVALCLWVAVVRCQDRMWVDAKINGKPARLVFDTGAGTGLLLFRPAAERLGLELRTAENQGTAQLPYWLTDECIVKLPWAF